MIKVILISSISALLLASGADLQNRIEVLEKEILSIKNSSEDNSFEISELLPILDEVEKKSILDKLNFAPELEISLSKFNYSVGNIEGENTLIHNNSNESLNDLTRRTNYSKNFDPASFIRFRLNANAKLDDKVSFRARMIFAQSSQSYQRLCILSRDIKTAQATSAFDVDRAYFDYTTNKNLGNAFTLTFGLLPTTGGTPMQFAQHAKRKSMFPALVFDMNTYGIIGTQKFAHNTFIRAIAAKAYTLRASFYPYQCNRENIDNAGVLGAYVDTKFNFIGNSLLSFGVNMLKDFKAHPYLGPDVSSADSHVLGDILTYGIGLDIQQVANTDTTLFFHTAISHPNGNGESDDYQIVAITDSADQADNQTLEDGLTASGLTGFSEADYAKGEMLSSNGYSIYIGAKYKTSYSLNFGAEYNYGSKYWFSATQGAEDMYNKLATRGHVTEAYASWNFHRNIYSKLGYIYSKENYTGSGWHFGEPAKKDATQKVTYLSVAAKF